MPKAKKTNNEQRTHKHKSFIRNFLFAFVGFSIAFLLINLFVDLNPKWDAPEVLKSKNGVLDVPLNIAKSNVKIGDKEMVKRKFLKKLF